MSKISKIISYGYRQTKNLSKDAAREVIDIRKLPVDVKCGYQTAKRLAEKNKMSTGRKTKIISTGVIRKGITPHLPGIMAGIGTIVPCIGMSAIGLALGKALQKVLRKI